MTHASAPKPRAILRCGRALACAALAALGVAAYGQTGAVDGELDSALLRPPQDSWPTYHGDYSGRRHSALTQITPDNVRTLALQWAFQTNQAQQIKASPILVDGIVYLTAPDNLWAVDARSGRQIWRYQHPANDAFHIGHRGVAAHGRSVFLTTPDAHLLAFDRFSGKLLWNVEVADSARGFWSTNAPLVIRDHVIVGVSGDFDNLPGTLRGFDPATGAAQWTF
jgi:alcohol dehydrogenase (cytochrome c)